jgi:hypothetical protein
MSRIFFGVAGGKRYQVISGLGPASVPCCGLWNGNLTLAVFCVPSEDDGRE